MSLTNIKKRDKPYRKGYADIAYKLTLLFGANDYRLAEYFDVTLTIFIGWKSEHEDLADAIKRGGTEANAKVAHALYTRAVGYTKTINKGGVENEYHYPADTNACFKWLSLRMRKDPESMWNEKEGNTTEKPPAEFDDVEIARKVAFILAKAIHGKTVEAHEVSRIAETPKEDEEAPKPGAPKFILE